MNTVVTFQIKPSDLRKKTQLQRERDTIKKVSDISAIRRRKLFNESDEEIEAIKKELESLKLTQTPRSFFQKKKKCDDVHFFEYINESLGIILLGMQQPKVNVANCIHMITQYNVKIYITFNEAMLHYLPQFKEERATFKRDCNVKDCEFYSIPIPDYTPPTVDQLLKLWLILDRFHLERAEGNPVNLLMHCTGGTGRTATMIMSYIWYKVFMMMREPTERLYRECVALMDSGISNMDLLKFVFENDIILFLMDEINKYTPEAKQEVFIDSFANEMNCVLFLNRILVIMQACIELQNGIINPVLIRLPGGIIKSGKRISKKGLKKMVEQHLPKKLDVIVSEHEPLPRKLEKEQTWGDWFSDLIGS